MRDCSDLDERAMCLLAGCNLVAEQTSRADESHNEDPNPVDDDPPTIAKDEPDVGEEFDWTTLDDASATNNNDDEDQEGMRSALVIVATAVVVIGTVVVIFVIWLWLYLDRQRKRLVGIRRELEQKEIQRVPTSSTTNEAAGDGSDGSNNKKPTATKKPTKEANGGPTTTTTEAPSLKNTGAIAVPKGTDDNGGGGTVNEMTEATDFEEAVVETPTTPDLPVIDELTC